MVIENGTFTRGTTGNCTVILNTAGMTPDLVFFFISSAGASDSVSHTSIGFMHAGGNGNINFFGDTTGDKSRQTNATKALSHDARVSGTITQIIAATGNGFALEEFTLNFTAANSGYTIGFLAIEF